MYSAHHAAVGTALTVGGYLAAGPVGVLVERRFRTETAPKLLNRLVDC